MMKADGSFAICNWLGKQERLLGKSLGPNQLTPNKFQSQESQVTEPSQQEKGWNFHIQLPPMNCKSKIQTDHKIQETFHHGVNLQSPMHTKTIAANIGPVRLNLLAVVQYFSLTTNQRIVLFSLAFQRTGP